MEFVGSELRLARLFNGFSLEEVGDCVGKTRQYIHKCETGQATPNEELSTDLAQCLRVNPEFFFTGARALTSEDLFHFRKLFTTRMGAKQVAMAHGEMMVRLASIFEQHLRLPDVKVHEFEGTLGTEDIERAADSCRRDWGLGMGPIDDMNRLAEHLGIFVTSFKSISKEVDALSVATQRPIIVRNESKDSPCRHRFDIGHELGHLALHSGVVTGDRITEGQANRFASAFLMPRSMMLKLFPKPKSSRFDWKAISEFKLEWKASKAAILYRARQLDLLTDSQYKTGVITLNRSGEATTEKEDCLIRKEHPELVQTSIDVLKSRKGIDEKSLAASMKITVDFLEEIVGLKLKPPERPALKLVH